MVTWYLQDHQDEGTGISRGMFKGEFIKILSKLSVLHSVSWIIWINKIQLSHTEKKYSLVILYYLSKVFDIKLSAFKWFIITFYYTDSSTIVPPSSCWLCFSCTFRCLVLWLYWVLWHEEMFILPLRSACGYCCSLWLHKSCLYIANIFY